MSLLKLIPPIPMTPAVGGLGGPASGLRTLLAGCLIVSSSLSCLSAAGGEETLLVDWGLTPGELPPDINLTDGQTVQVEVLPAHGEETVGMRADLKAGNRNEFEWRSADQRVFYKHYEGKTLWVGFRMAVESAGQNESTSFFQVGPVRDGKNETQGTGHYQLMLKGERKSGWTWREFAGWPNIGGNRTTEAPRIVNPANLERGFTTEIGPFEPGQVDSWVVQVRMLAPQTDPGAEGGSVRVWRNGRLVFRRDGPNALPGDYTRVKWGPYIGQSGLEAPISATYSDFRLATSPGGDGYRLVAPALRVGVPRNLPWRRTIKAPPGTREIRVSGLSDSLAFDPDKSEISGLGESGEEGSRILFEFLDSSGEDVGREVWVLDFADAGQEALKTSSHEAPSRTSETTSEFLRLGGSVV